MNKFDWDISGADFDTEIKSNIKVNKSKESERDKKLQYLEDVTPRFGFFYWLLLVIALFVPFYKVVLGLMLLAHCFDGAFRLLSSPYFEEMLNDIEELTKKIENK